MALFVKHLFYFTVGLYWMGLWAVKIFIDLIFVGPRKLFQRFPAEEMPPSLLQDPAYGEHRYVTVNKVKLHYVISGPDKAPLMLMLHGFPEIWYSWRHQIKEFQKDFRVVAVDMRGFGDSDKPTGLDNYKLEVLAHDVKQLIQELGYKSCVLVSHDWGGAVAWAFASYYPEMVDRLMVMNIPPASIWHEGFTSFSNPLQFLASGYIYFFHLSIVPEFFAGLQDGKMLDDMFLKEPIGVRSGLMTKDDVACYKYFFRRPGALTAAMNYYRANLYVQCPHHELHYPMPVLIIWGCKDLAITSSLLDKTVQAIPLAKVVRIPESSHWVQMDQPEQVSDAMRNFLNETKYQMYK